jgi:urea transport system substrate-binding protein
MLDESRLLELLVEWEQREDAREGVRLEDLCRDEPELLEPLRQRVRVLRAMRGVLNTQAYEETPEGTAAGTITSPPGYQIVQVVGRGGMGVVYKAWQEGLDRIVALKMILAGEHADERTLARFQAEAKMVARLQHPNIVQVFEIGAHQGRPFIALEYLAGGNLETVLQDFTLTPQEAARLTEVLARAVHHAHLHGVVHRDLKPGNVLFTHATPGPDGRPRLGEPKIVDFGLARQLDRGKRLTASGAVMGTPYYMAPEQASGKTDLLGPSVDIFALGVMLYEMLTSRLPFDGRNEWEVIQAVISKEPEAPGALNPLCPPDLEAICLRCLRKDAAQRYATAEQLAEDLQRFLAGEKPAPATLASVRRHWRWQRWAGGGLVAAVAAWVLFLAFWHPPQEPLRLGVLAPLRGDMWQNGQAVVDAVNLAAEEINAAAGARERRIEIVAADDFSDEDAGAAAAKLIEKDRVCSLLGCWSSVSRKAVLPVLARREQLLIYPAEFEGLEESNHVVYLGTVPNQIVLPALDWLCRTQKCQRLALVGNDELFDRAVNQIIRDHLKQAWPETQVVADVYVDQEVALPERVAEIKKAMPDLVVNLISGGLNANLFAQLRSPGSPLRTTPVLAVDCTERDLNSVPKALLPGIYLCGSYFAGLDNSQAKGFESRFRARYGGARTTFDVMQAAYAGVHLWARAARQVGTDPLAIRQAILSEDYQAPEGPIRFEALTGYAVRHARLARYDDAGKLGIVWQSETPLVPIVFPPTRTRAQWEQLLTQLYEGWGGHWRKMLLE